MPLISRRRAHQDHGRTRSMASLCRPLTSIGVTVAVVATLTALAAVPVAVAPAAGQSTANPSGSFAITSCDPTTLATDVAAGGDYTFDCSGTITLTQQLVVPQGDTVSLDGTGTSVTIAGCTNPCATRLFDVQYGGNLTLTNLTLTGGNVVGFDGLAGDDGADGTDGVNPGDGGGSANVGTDGDDANGAAGGALNVDAGGTVSLISVDLSGNTVAGGSGGDGGNGGTGGDGQAGYTPTSLGSAPGGMGGSGGNGGNGAPGGSGGSGEGGAIFNAGTLTITSSVLADDTASGGAGGNGGNGGGGGSGGGGGGGAFNAGSYVVGGTGGNGGPGGDGGNGSVGGFGGAADGGAIFNTGGLTLDNVAFDNDSATGGNAGNGGTGAGGGAGGNGGGGGWSSYAVGATGGDGAVGGTGGSGGDGGANAGGASGGALASTVPVTVDPLTFSEDAVTGGHGGAGADGGAGGTGGPGGSGGPDSADGEAILNLGGSGGDGGCANDNLTGDPTCDDSQLANGGAGAQAGPGAGGSPGQSGGPGQSAPPANPIYTNCSGPGSGTICPPGGQGGSGGDQGDGNEGGSGYYDVIASATDPDSNITFSSPTTTTTSITTTTTTTTPTTEPTATTGSPPSSALVPPSEGTTTTTTEPSTTTTERSTTTTSGPSTTTTTGTTAGNKPVFKLRAVVDVFIRGTNASAPSAVHGHLQPGAFAMATRVIELEENFIPVLYNDDDPQNLHPSRDHGNCTIGYGTKLHDGPCTAADHERYPGPITRQQAQALLERDEATAAAAVTSYVHVKLSAAQQAALMSFSYNVGSEALRGSTLVRLLNRGDRTGAANQLLRWVHANGQRLPGLVNRRQRERQIFLGTAPVGANLTAPSQSRAIGPDIISQASPVSVALVPPGTLTAGEIATLVGGGATAGCVINLSVVVPGQSPYPVIALPPVTAGDDGSFTVRWPVPSSLTDSLTWTVSGAETCL